MLEFLWWTFITAIGIGIGVFVLDFKERYSWHW
jgi:hypothetical protein